MRYLVGSIIISMNKKLFLLALRNTTLAVIYILTVVLIMENGNKLFGNNSNNIIGALFMLILFSLSAAVVGGLVFGKSIMLFFEKKMSEGLKSAIYSICWLGIYLIITLIGLFIFK